MTSSSVDAQLKQLNFIDYNPKWTHLAYDQTSFVPGVSNGYSHLFMHSCTPVVEGDYMYTLSVNGDDFFQGGFLEKISIKDGKLMWARSKRVSN